MADAYRDLPPIAGGGAAVITGGASGIGLAAARRFAGLGMPVVIADLPGERLEAAQRELSALTSQLIAAPLDVSRAEDFDALRDTVLARFGHVGVLMNNAGTSLPIRSTFAALDQWKTLLNINFWGAVHGTQAFAPAMTASGKPGFIINTGSKQGITTPPGSPAYNVSKAALKSYTEALAHELRNTPGNQVSAHLLVPGYTHTGLTGAGAMEKPPAAWSGEQVVGFMLDALKAGAFYIICPDNETTREIDERRMQWAMGDLIENRPALSRWHPDYKDAFAAFMAAKS